MEAEILYEPRLSQINDVKKTYLIQRGGQSVQYFPFTAQSTSNSSLVFKCDPPTFDTVVDRVAIISVPISVVIEGNSGDNNQSLLQDGRFALRAYPFSSCVNSLNLNINGQSITTQTRDVVHMLSRYNNTPESRSTFGSIFPNTLDAYQSYADQIGASNNVLNSYTDMIQGVYQPRGSFPMNVTENSRTKFEATMVLYEYVNISPFYHRRQQGGGGLANIRNLTLNYQLSNLNRMFSGMPIPNAGGGGIAMTVNILEGSTVFMGFVSPPEGMTIPRTISYAYDDLSYYSNLHAVVPAGDSRQLTSNVLQFAYLPERVYVCVRKSQGNVLQDITSQLTSTDTYFSITQVNVNFNNVDGIQSATTQVDLYQQSERNGLSSSWVEFSGETTKLSNAPNPGSTTFGTVGSVVCFEFGKDIPLRGYDSVGMSKAWNFQVRVQAKNVAGVDIVPELAIVAQYDGIMSLIAPGQCDLTLGFITPGDVQNAAISDMNYETVRKLYGGGPFSSISKFIKHPWARKIAQKACDELEKYNSSSGSGVTAGALSGGSVVPRRTLKERAMQ